ncbi:MAG: hypothetical protein LBU79_03825 [Planctomycetota bacterium]|nr:hypothetical protein [Planctomycetota bacterium]
MRVIPAKWRLSHTVLAPKAHGAPDSGVALLPERVVFAIANLDQYNF